MRLLFGATATFVFLAGVPALAQTAPAQYYGTLGYTQVSTTLEDEDGILGDGIDLDAGAITGRLGARFGQYFGVEGEASFGVKDSEDSLVANVGGASVTLDTSYKLNNALAVYGIGFLPVSPNGDLFARIGVGRLNSEFEVTARSGGVVQSEGLEGDSNFFAIGGGYQHFFNGPNGVRAEYTVLSLDGEDGEDRDSFGALGLSYVRKF